MTKIHLSIVALVLLSGCLSSVRGTKNHSDIVTAAADIEQWIIDIRRELHTFPELMFKVRNSKIFVVYRGFCWAGLFSESLGECSTPGVLRCRPRISCAIYFINTVHIMCVGGKDKCQNSLCFG